MQNLSIRESIAVRLGHTRFTVRRAEGDAVFLTIDIPDIPGGEREWINVFPDSETAARMRILADAIDRIGANAGGLPPPDPNWEA